MVEDSVERKDLMAHQLVRYLEARGVTHVFGLCGHTNIAVLSAMANSRLKFVQLVETLEMVVERRFEGTIQ